MAPAEHDDDVASEPPMSFRELMQVFGRYDAIDAALAMFGTDDVDDLIPSAAVGICGAAWRNTVLEGDHAAGRITDAEMFVASVLTTHHIVGILEALVLGGVDFEALADDLADPSRTLGNGLSVGSVVTDLDALWYDAITVCCAISVAVREYGLLAAFGGFAVAGASYNAGWWGHPWWPLGVAEAARVDAREKQLAGGSVDAAIDILVNRPWDASPDLQRWASSSYELDVAVRSARETWREHRGLHRGYVPPIFVAFAPIPMPWFAAGRIIAATQFIDPRLSEIDNDG